MQLLSEGTLTGLNEFSIDSERLEVLIGRN